MPYCIYNKCMGKVKQVLEEVRSGLILLPPDSVTSPPSTNNKLDDNFN